MLFKKMTHFRFFPLYKRWKSSVNENSSCDKEEQCLRSRNSAPLLTLTTWKTSSSKSSSLNKTGTMTPPRTSTSGQQEAPGGCPLKTRILAIPPRRDILYCKCATSLLLKSNSHTMESQISENYCTSLGLSKEITVESPYHGNILTIPAK